MAFPSTPDDDDLIPYRPSVYYFRRALREAETRERAITIGLIACHELEQLREWVRSEGLVPPQWIIDPREAEDNGWSLKPASPPPDQAASDF